MSELLDAPNPFDAFDGANPGARLKPVAANPFDAFDDEPVDRLEIGPQPGLAERFRLNAREGFDNSIAGAAINLVAPGEPSTKARRRAEYEALPQWQTPVEGLVAFGGQFAGALPSPENFVEIGLGARLMSTVAPKAGPLLTRIVAGATDAAAVNAVADPAVQGLQMAAGDRERFDWVQYAASIGLGGLIGGAIHGAAAKLGGDQHRPGEMAADVMAGLQPVRHDLSPELPPDLVPGARVRVHDPAPPDAPDLGPGARHGMTGTVIDLRNVGAIVMTDDGATGFVGAKMLQVEPSPEVGRPAADAGPDAAPDAVAPPPLDAPSPARPEPGPKQVADAVPLPEPAEALGDRMARDIAIAEARPADRAALPALPSHVRDIGDGPHGPVLDGFADDWSGAVTWLQQAKTGDARGVLAHPEVPGRIDLVWGDYNPATGKGGGLSKIAAKHPEVLADLPERLSSMQVESRSANRIRLIDGNNRAVIRLDYDGAEKVWLFTAYEKGRRAGGTTESPGIQRADSHSSSTPSAKEMVAPPPSGGKAPDVLAMRAGLGQGLEGEVGRPQAGIARGVAAHAEAGVRLLDIIDGLVAGVEPASVRQGHMPPGHELHGTYAPGSGAVRLRSTQDFEVVAHELGHHVEVRLDAAGAEFVAAEADILSLLAYQGARPEDEVAEGFAELVRLMVTNPAHIDHLAPGLRERFEAVLDAHDPDLRASLDAAAAAYRAWRSQPSGAAVSASIVSGRRPGVVARVRDALGDLAGTVAGFFDTVYRGLMDDLHPIQVGVRRLTAIYAERTGRRISLNAVNDPYKLARMSRGAFQAGHVDIMHGVVPHGGLDPATPALRDAIILATGAPNVLGRLDPGRLQQFGAYLWSRRALGEWERFDRGEIPNPPDKLTRGDHLVNVHELEALYPEFDRAATMAHEWQHGLWTKKFEAGLITREQFEAGLALKDYVPGLRHFAENEGGVPEGMHGGKTGRGAMVHRFRGSDRDVINPLESMVMDAYETASAIARNEAVAALDRLARLAGNGAAAIAERIPAHELRALMVDPLEVIDSAARAAGLEHADAVAVRDLVEGAVGPDAVALFRPAMISPKNEPIVFFREGGRIQALRLADGKFGHEMVAAFNMMTRHEREFWTTWIGKISAIKRAGIVLHPGFLIANLVRDQATAIILYGRPFQRLAATAAGLADEVMQRDAARIYAQMGGISGGAATSAMHGLAERDLQKLARRGWQTRVMTLKGATETSEIAESATRKGLFRTFMDEARARGLNEHDAAFEAAWQARDYMDFDRRGSVMGGWSRLVPFLNASVQGFDKTVRTTLVPIAKRLAGQMLTAEDERALPNAVRAWARLGIASAIGVTIWHYASSQPGADEVSMRTRATHWLFRKGDEWIVVPKPFEMAAILNAGEAAYDALVKADPTAWERYRSSLGDVLLPPSLVEDATVPATVYENATNRDLFTGRDIVPEHMKALEPWLQYTARTSQLARDIGEITGWSPLKVEHFFLGLTGSVGRSFIALSDRAGGERPQIGWAEAILLNRFVKDASKGATSVGAFWDLVSQTGGSFERVNRAWRFMEENGQQEAAAAYIARQPEEERAYVTVLEAPAVSNKRGKFAVKRIHPLVRARDALGAIGTLRKDIVDDGLVRSSEGDAPMNPVERRMADDILSKLAMAEARNAMIVMKRPGWDSVRPPIPTDTYIRELQAVSPAAAKALADRYRTNNVLPFDRVVKAWGLARAVLLKDGTNADIKAIVLDAYGHKRGKTELGGKRVAPKTRGGIHPAAEDGEDDED